MTGIHQSKSGVFYAWSKVRLNNVLFGCLLCALDPNHTCYYLWMVITLHAASLGHLFHSMQIPANALWPAVGVLIVFLRLILLFMCLWSFGVHYWSPWGGLVNETHKQ